MANDAAQQTSKMIFAGEPVILNIGLLGPTYAKPQGLSQGTILGRASKHLRTMMAPLQGEVNQDNDEPVLIVTGMFVHETALTTALYDMVSLCDQDCIAIWYPSIGTGYLFGPYAQQWGEFNPEFFKLPLALRNTGRWAVQ